MKTPYYTNHNLRALRQENIEKLNLLQLLHLKQLTRVKYRIKKKMKTAGAALILALLLSTTICKGEENSD